MLEFRRHQNSLYSVAIGGYTFWYSCGVCVAVYSSSLGMIVRATERPSEVHMHSKHLAMIEGERPRRFNRSQGRVSAAEFDRFLGTIRMSIEVDLSTAHRATVPNAEASTPTAERVVAVATA